MSMDVSTVREVGEFTPLAPVLLQELRRSVGAGVAAYTSSNEDCWNGGVSAKQRLTIYSGCIWIIASALVPF